MHKKVLLFILYILPLHLFGQYDLMGKIVDKNGHPIPDVHVKVKKISVQARTNSNGEFKIFAPQGRILVFQKKGYIRKSLTIKAKHQKELIIALKKKGSLSDDLLINGKVIDFESGEPLIGASIQIKNTAIGVTTDIDGLFELKVPRGALLLVGYGHYAGPSEFKIEKEGYQEFIPNSPKAYFSKNTTQVTIQTPAFNQGNIHHPLQLVQGKITGLMNSMGGGNNPFGVYHTRIRGLSSFNGENRYGNPITTAEPLVVVDGLPAADITLLDPLAITSIKLIKDGTAAQYGMRGASGVLEINTSPSQKTGIHYHTYVGIDRPDLTMEFLNAKTYRSTPGSYDLGKDTDWFKAVSRKAVSHTHQLTLANKHQNTTYQISTIYRKANGILKQQGFDRIQLNASLQQYALNKQLQLTALIRTTNQDNNYSEPQAFRFAQSMNPTAPVLEANNQFGGYHQQILFNYYNPVAMIEQNVNTEQQSRFFTSLSAQLSLLDQLQFITQYSHQNQQNKRATYISKESFWNSGTNRNGWASQSANGTKNHFFDTHLKFKESKGILKSQVKLGYQYQSFDNTNFNVAGGDFLTDVFSYNNLAAATDFVKGNGTINSYRAKYQLAAYYTQAQFHWKEAIYLTAGWRIEDASRLGKETSLGHFPYVSTTINLGKLSKGFFNKNEVQFRGSFGISGNLPFDNYLSLRRFSPQLYNAFYYNGEYRSSYGVQYDENPFLKWEEKKEWQIGFQLAPTLLDKKFQITMDLYQSQSGDIIREVVNDLNRSYFDNIGGLKNTGLEIALTLPVIEKNNFSWHTNLLLSTNKTILTNYSNDPNYQSIERLPGREPNGGCCKVSAVLYEEGGEVGNFNLLAFENISANGQWVFADIDGDQRKDDIKDKTIVGNGTPNWLIGWHNQFHFGKFDLNLFFRGALGHDNFNITRKLTENPGQISAYNILSSTFEGASARLTDAPQESSYYIENASFLRLDNVKLGYTFDLGNHKFLQNLAIYAVAQNVFTISNYSGWDPDYRLQAGNDVFATGYEFRNVYLPTKSFTFGLRIGLK